MIRHNKNKNIEPQRKNMETCPICNETTNRRMINNKTYGRLCDRCYQRKKRKKIIYPLPEYGVIEYDPDGKPICHICGESYDKVLSHAYHTHGITAYDYKKEFGLDVTKGIISEQAKKTAKENVLRYYNRVIAENLTKRGQTTRFKKGHKGRTKAQMSEQTRLRLVHQNKKTRKII